MESTEADGLDRGRRNLESVFTLSCHSVDWDEDIEWYLDRPAPFLALKIVISLVLALRSKRGCHAMLRSLYSYWCFLRKGVVSELVNQNVLSQADCYIIHREVGYPEASYSTIGV